MLINCPRCGLSQPDDQYCAQCGVNMHSFKQKEKPLFIKIISNAFFQISVLLIIGFIVAQSLFQNQQKNWFKQITHFQGVSKSVHGTKNPTQAEIEEAMSTERSAQVQANFNDQESAEFKKTESLSSSKAASTNTFANTEAQSLSAINFKIIYAEVKISALDKWVQDSLNLGQYQNLTNYSAGIISDFRNRKDTSYETLKTVDFKLAPGRVDSNLSGILSQDSNQMIGLVTSLEFKSQEADMIQGEINVTKSSSQSTENYPAEFSLHKGAIFFIIGAIKRENFTADRARLNMPPFQIFKSADFMTHKTEFVIIIEPNYN